MVQSIERAMTIVNTLISNPRKRLWSLSEIAKAVNLPLSSVHRLTNSLMEYGLVTQDQDSKRYQVGYKWMEIGFWLRDHLDFRGMARPIMEELAHQVHESVYLSIPDGDASIIIERVDSPSNVRIIDNLGERIPLHIGAANKSMLAFMNETKIQHLINQLIHSDSEQHVLMTQLQHIRTQGFAVSTGEKTKGTTSVAAPVLGMNGEVIGSLYINMLTDHKDVKRLEKLAQEVMEAANKVSRQAGKAP